ncbi:hypothetical protein D3C80_1614030 [compost metagenome]
MRGAAGVVDQHVEAAVTLDHRIDQALSLLDVAHVAGYELRLAAAMGRQTVRRVAPADHHLGAALEEAQADAAPNPLAAAGDQDHLAAEIDRIVHAPPRWPVSDAFKATRAGRPRLRPKGLGAAG